MRVTLAAVALVASGCILGPGDFTGTYHLETVGGVELPAMTPAGDDDSVTVLVGVWILRPDSTFRMTHEFAEPDIFGERIFITTGTYRTAPIDTGVIDVAFQADGPNSGPEFFAILRADSLTDLRVDLNTRALRRAWVYRR